TAGCWALAGASGIERANPLDAAAIDEADGVVRIQRQESLGETIEEVEQPRTLVRQLDANAPLADHAAEQRELHGGEAHAGRGVRIAILRRAVVGDLDLAHALLGEQHGAAVGEREREERIVV